MAFNKTFFKFKINPLFSLLTTTQIKRNISNIINILMKVDSDRVNVIFTPCQISLEQIQKKQTLDCDLLPCL
ncbi:unnamed protein product [Rotaria magnacalcarata]